MFGYFRRNRAKVVVQSIVPGLREGIQALPVVDRAATFALVHAMLEVAADQWGQAVLRSPTRLPADTAAAAVLILASHHARLVRDGLGQMQDRGMDDVAYAHAMRETRATELLVGTLGACLYEGPRTEVQEAWKLLWKARASAPEGVAALVQYGRLAKVDPVPRSRRRIQGTPSPELLRLATTLPPFLQPRKPAPPAAPKGAKPAPRPVGKAVPKASAPGGARPNPARGRPAGPGRQGNPAGDAR